MVEPHLYAQIVEYLDRHSTRPRKAIRLWAHLFSALPPDSNEVMLTRDELAEKIGVRPSDVSAIMGELQEVGAVYRERHGRGVRYFVNPRLGTHMGGAVRDRAQAAAPFLRLVGPDPEPEAA
jgi:DNA-binding transcriptional ArsR family regulator